MKKTRLSETKLRYNKVSLIIALIAVISLGAFYYFQVSEKKIRTSTTKEKASTKKALQASKGIIYGRTARSDTFYNKETREYTKNVYVNSVNYKDKNGKWQKIDTNLEIEGSKLKVEKAPYSIFFSKNINEPVKFKAGKNSIIFLNEGVKNAKASVEESKATYPNVYKNTDVERIATSEGLKQNYILKANGHPNNFKENLKTNLKPEIQSNGLVNYYKGEEVVGVSPRPFVKDANGTIRNVKFQLDGSMLTTVLPSLKGLKYPIILDPSIQFRANAQGAGKETFAIYEYRAVYPGWNWSPQFSDDDRFAVADEVYAYREKYVSFLEFDISGLQAGKVINFAYLYLKPKSSGGYYIDDQVQVQSIDESWDEVLGGGDQQYPYEPPPYGAFNSASIGVYSGDYRAWDVKDLVTQWYTGARPNYGMVLEPTQEGVYYDYWSSDNSYSIFAQNYPALSINYSEPPPDTVAPISIITSPLDNSYIKGPAPISITGTSSDNPGGRGVNLVRISTNGGSSWSDATIGTDWSNWTYSWPMPADGVYNLISRARDAAVPNNWEAIGAGISVTVDNTSPTAEITSPASGANITGAFDMNGTATDTNFKQYVIEYGTGPSPTTWSQFGTIAMTPVSNGLLKTISAQALNGEYTFRLKVTDNAGNESTKSVTVNLSNIPAENPHGNYTQDPEQCAICHRSHTATIGKLLTSSGSTKYQSDFCYTCHDGSGSIYNVMAAFDTNPSHHPIKDQYYIDGSATYPDESSHLKDDHKLDCSQCHDPHGTKKPDGTYYAKLLKSKDQDGNEYYEGNEFCGACHGPGSTLLGGDHLTVFNTIPHNTDPKIPDPPATSVVSPGESTKIKCLICHANNNSSSTEGEGPHGSDNSRLTKLAEEQLCYSGCHEKTDYSENSINIKQRFTMGSSLSSRHNVAAAEQVDADPNTNGNQPSKIECISCHNPHLNGRGNNKLADPENTFFRFEEVVLDPKGQQSVTIKNGQSTGSVVDARITQGAVNNGDATPLIVGKRQSKKERSLIYFNLSSIPSGVTITQASLLLPNMGLNSGTPRIGTNSLDVEVYRVIENWAQSSATWDKRDTNNNWATAGGSYDPTAIDSVATPGPSGSSYRGDMATLDVTNLVANWKNGIYPNNGLILIATAAEAYGGTDWFRDFDSSENQAAGAVSGSIQPTLVVVYYQNTPASISDQATFCIRCHDNDPPQGVIMPDINEERFDRTGATTITLYDIFDLPKDYLDPIKGDYHGGRAGGTHAAGGGLRADRGYYSGMVLQCSECHDPHGSNKKFHLKGLPAPPLGTRWGFSDMAPWCESCHVLPAHASGNPAWAQYCGSCHSHGAKKQWNYGQKGSF